MRRLRHGREVDAQLKVEVQWEMEAWWEVEVRWGCQEGGGPLVEGPPSSSPPSPCDQTRCTNAIIFIMLQFALNCAMLTD